MRTTSLQFSILVTTLFSAGDVGSDDYNMRLSQRRADSVVDHPSVTATVEGHTGNLQGTPEEAMDISRRGAQNVVNSLVDNFGVARSRLAVEGFGQTRRVAYNTSLEGQQENRRVNIIFNFQK